MTSYRAASDLQTISGGILSFYLCFMSVQFVQKLRNTKHKSDQEILVSEIRNSHRAYYRNCMLWCGLYKKADTFAGELLKKCCHVNIIYVAQITNLPHGGFSICTACSNLLTENVWTILFSFLFLRKPFFQL